MNDSYIFLINPIVDKYDTDHLDPNCDECQQFSKNIINEAILSRYTNVPAKKSSSILSELMSDRKFINSHSIDKKVLFYVQDKHLLDKLMFFISTNIELRDVGSKKMSCSP